MSCVAVGCNNRTNRKPEGISFHNFPKEPHLRQLWEIAVSRKDWSASPRSYLCSEHFDEEYLIRHAKRVLLREGALPTIFQHKQKVYRRRQKIPERQGSGQREAAPGDVEELQFAFASSASIKEGAEVVLTDGQEDTGAEFPESASFKRFRSASPEVHKPPAEEHGYALPMTKSGMRAKLLRLMRTNASLRLKLQRISKKLYRSRKAANTLKDVVDDLRKDKVISDNACGAIQAAAQNIPAEIVELLASNLKSGKIVKKCQKYSDAIREFAITLQFYSSSAYDYVRQVCGNALPVRSTIARWFSNVRCEPGFTSQAFATLETLAKKSEDRLLVNLLMDEISIKKQIQWTGKKFSGYVDIGAGTDDDSLPPAKEALVMMCVAANGHFKLPLAYFFIEGLGGQERANLVNICLEKLHSTGVVCTSLTCDGPQTNQKMLQILGVNLHHESIKPWFPHPCNGELKVYVLLDVCHALKLVRNILASQPHIKSPEDEEISWRFIEELHNVQVSEGTRAGCKLQKKHIAWTKNKMKVGLAASTLSRSVADALDFCRIDCKNPKFSESAATSKFLRMIDRVFDILNSRNPLARGTKAPMSSENKAEWESIFSKTLTYIMKLKTWKGQLLVTSKQKTGFIGFILAIKTFRGLYVNYVEKGPLNHIITYKWSQDHLELFFGMLRSKLGDNNNPTCLQFQHIYRRLMVRQQVKCGKNGNCTPQDTTSLLACTTISAKPKVMVDKSDDIDPLDLPAQFSFLPGAQELSDFKKGCVGYISGFVTKKCLDKVECEQCYFSLFDPEPELTPYHALTNQKRWGSLHDPSKDTLLVCELTEKTLCEFLKKSGGKPPAGKNVRSQIEAIVLKGATLQRST